MKKFITTLLVLVGLALPFVVSAAVFIVPQGGTGASTFGTGGVIYSNGGTKALRAVATTTNALLFSDSTGALTWVATSSLNITPSGTLGVANGGTGATTLTGLLQGNGTNPITTVTDSSTIGQVLRVTGASTYGWGALDLTDGDAITGALGASNGGTGITSLGAGIATWLGTPTAANLRTAVSGTTGTAGNLVFSNSPTLVTPDIGAASATTIDTGHGANEVYVVGDGLAVSTNDLIFDCSDVASTGLQCSGEDLQLNATGDWTGTVDGNNFAGGAIGAGDLLYGASAGSITELSIGASSTVLTTAGATPKWQSLYAAMIGDLAAGIATWLVTPTSANLDTAVTDDVGSGALVFATSPTFTTSALSPVWSSTAADTADAGVIRLGNAEVIGWEASPAGTDVTLSVDTSEVLNLAGGGFTATAGTATFGTLAGALDAGGATSFEIPNGTGPTVDAIGEIGLDTTDNQLLVASSTTAGSPLVFPGVQKLWAATIASTSVDFVSGGIIPLPPLRDGMVIKEIHCYVETGTSVVINISDGTNDTETLTCATTITSDTAISNNPTFTAGELARLEIGTVTGSVDYLMFSVWGTWTRE